jgi:hypothetical protein
MININQYHIVLPMTHERYCNAPPVTATSTVRIGIQEHVGTTDISLYIDGINVGALTQEDVERLVAGLQGNRTEITPKAFKEYHFLS